MTQCITNMETAFQNCAWVSRHLNSLLWNALHGFTGNDAGYEMERTGVGMPSYLGVLKDHEIDSVILFIKTLKK